MSAYDIRRSSARPSSAGRAAVSLLLLLSDGSRGRRDRGGSARRGHLRRGRFGEEGAKGRVLGRAGPAAMYVRGRRVGWRRRGKYTRIRQDGRARVHEMGRQSTEEGEEAGRRSEREGEARARDGRAEFQVQAQLTSARSQRPSDPPLHQLVLPAMVCPPRWAHNLIVSLSHRAFSISVLLQQSPAGRHAAVDQPGSD